MERTAIITYLKERDSFFRKVNFDAYSLEELKRIKERWEALPLTEYEKKPKKRSKRSD